MANLSFEIVLIFSTALAAFVGTLILVERFRHYAIRNEILDIPNERSSHTEAVPRGGGVIIVLISIFFSLLLDFLILKNLNLYFFVSLLGIAAVSYIDDKRDLSPLFRLFSHFCCALFFVWGNGYISKIYLPAFGTLDLGLVGAVLTVLWIVWMTNAYNFMDGIDGIAAGTGVIAGLIISVAMFSGDQISTCAPLLIAVSCAGFLYHNWNPAKIFMGDVGSAFLGFAFASVTIIKAPNAKEGRIALFLISVSVLLPFFLDTVITFWARVFKRENFLKAHRSHFYQQLSERFSHAKVTIIYLIFSIVTGIVGYFASRHLH